MWSATVILPGDVKEFQFGPLRVWIRRTRTTWQFASHYVDAQQNPQSDPPEYQGDDADGSSSPAAGSPELRSVDPDRSDLNWVTHIADREESEVTFQPALPDRPLVVHTVEPFQLAPHARYTLFTAIPACVRAWIGDPGAQLLFDLPTVSFSNTWFGGAMNGRLCYTSPRFFARHSEDVAPTAQGAQVICPLLISNRSAVPFQFSKSAIFAHMLRIYRVGKEYSDRSGNRGPKRNGNFAGQDLVVRSAEGQLWTNEATVTFTPEEELNVSVGSRFPNLDHVVREVSPPREVPSENLFRRSMILFRRISNYE